MIFSFNFKFYFSAGEILSASNPGFDFESVSEYSVYVRATEVSGVSYVEALTVIIIDTDESPQFPISSITVSVDEEQVGVILYITMVLRSSTISSINMGRWADWAP